MMKTIKIKSILGDIRFWILLFFLIRLVGILNPPLEIGHNWRQSLTNMVSRNFLEGNSSILYPTIDMAGNESGIIGTEFPFYNYLIYSVSAIFDYSHWYGRLINLIVSSFGIYYFYLLLTKVSTIRIAKFATIVLLSSIWFGYSRKIMPDTFSVSLVIIGLYYCHSYLTKGSFKYLLLYFAFSTIGVLCKIPALSLISVLGLILLMKEIQFDRKKKVIVASTISFGIVCLWYFYWVPYLVEMYHFPLYFPKGFKEGLLEILPLLPDLSEKFYFSSLFSYIALPFLVFGLVTLIRSDQRYLKIGLSIITFVFVIFIIKTGAVFPLHSYYIVPFTPIMALLVGIGLSKLPTKWAIVAVSLIAFEGIMNQQHDFFIKDSEQHKAKLESILDQHIGKKELIIINGGPSPQDIYFAHRKGWTLESDSINQSKVEELHELGARYLVIEKNKFSTPIDYAKSVYSDADYEVYLLEK